MPSVLQKRVHMRRSFPRSVMSQIKKEVPIAISGETSVTTPRIQGAVILRSIQQDSGELDPLQYGILAARGGVLSNSHACSRLNSGSLNLPVRIHTVPE